jgi:hypothetical protein
VRDVDACQVRSVLCVRSGDVWRGPVHDDVSVEFDNNVFMSCFAEALNNSDCTADKDARKSIIRFVGSILETASQNAKAARTSYLYSTFKRWRRTEISSFNPSVLEKLVGFSMCSSAPNPCEA